VAGCLVTVFVNKGQPPGHCAPGLADRRQRVVARTPLGRLGRAADIVSTILFLLLGDSGLPTRQTLVVDGGTTIRS